MVVVKLPQIKQKGGRGVTPPPNIKITNDARGGIVVFVVGFAVFLVVLFCCRFCF